MTASADWSQILAAASKLVSWHNDVQPLRLGSSIHPRDFDDFLEIMYTALASSGRCELKRVIVARIGQRVVLTGIVHSYYMKQLAQEAIRPFLFGTKIRNDLLVVSQSGGHEPTLQRKSPESRH